MKCSLLVNELPVTSGGFSSKTRHTEGHHPPYHFLQTVNKSNPRLRMFVYGHYTTVGVSESADHHSLLFFFEYGDSTLAEIVYAWFTF